MTWLSLPRQSTNTMDRETLQGIAAHRLAKENRLVCQWATGVGKSKVALQFLKDNPGMDCLILVPEQNNIENWKDEFSKFGVPMELVHIACYASLHKYENTAWDLLVIDECPHMDTEKRKALFRTIRARYVLALGAVIDKDEMDTLESVYGHFEKSYVPLAKAIEWGILVPPTVHIFHMTLDDSSTTFWHKGSAYTEKGYYRILEQNVEKTVNAYNANPNQFNKSRMFRAGNDRKRFLGKRKAEAVESLCRRLNLQGKRYLCFCSSVKQAEHLGKDFAFTSMSPVSFRHLERFNNHEINALFVVGKLIEGQNLKDIDCGIITQLGGTSRITVQEVGRVLRSPNPVIYIPVFDGTKDDSFMYTLTSNIPAEYIKHHSL